jgi:HPt (histidine-containing phosphotransfer) domain-containing protein
MEPVELDALTWSGLEYLESISGPGAIAEMVGDFLADAPGRLVRMQAALMAGERQILNRLAHDLKSNSATVGLLELSALAARLEHLAETGAAQDLAALLAEAEALLPQALNALAERVKKYPS